MERETGRGFFFAFEGIDGSGKTTQLERLRQRLAAEGFRCLVTREPTEGPVGSLLRQILTGRTAADYRVIASLFTVDRIDHLVNDTDGILKRVREGVTVLTDRYYFSSYAYQGGEMGLDWVIDANSVSAGLLRPDLTVFLDVPAERAMERIQKNRYTQELFEKEERLREVRQKYLEAFGKLRDQERVAVIDADAGEDAVADRVWEAVSPLLRGDPRG